MTPNLGKTLDYSEIRRRRVKDAEQIIEKMYEDMTYSNYDRLAIIRKIDEHTSSCTESCKKEIEGEQVSIQTHISDNSQGDNSMLWHE